MCHDGGREERLNSAPERTLSLTQGRIHLARSGAGAGTHWAWVDEQGQLVVEWYDHGPDVPYESANQLRFAPDAVRALLELDAPSDEETLAALRQRFETWWEVRKAALEREVPFTSEVDFLP